MVDDPNFHKSGDIKIDCDDRKAVLMLNIRDPKQENAEEVIVHELMHLKMYPLDQVTESLLLTAFPEAGRSRPGLPAARCRCRRPPARR